MGFVGLGLVVAVFVGPYLWDRQTKRHGRTLRSPYAIGQSERDVHRNVRASNRTFDNPVDSDWAKPDEQRYKH